MESGRDAIKEAFQKAKNDIDYLKNQILEISNQIKEIKEELLNKPKETQTQPTQNELNLLENTNFPTHKLTELNKLTSYVPKDQYIQISSGNEGVPTNQQTNKPTVQPTNQRSGNEGVPINTNFNPTDKYQRKHPKSNINHLERVSEILASLDNLKKEVRIKFKRLTEQEMTVFTSIYELDNNGFEVTYELLAQSLKLSEISIRDYIRKIVAKGIPLIKSKENNKKITLQIPEELKQIASIDTINQLRSL